ncbi:hypothetical protein vBVpaMR16F_42 [Vibrio phage vB_VpaM_R16F]|nr:hypothetical protein vBVpaMR16F_42 [Vibrio phage vB_VpaM_R16F]
MHNRNECEVNKLFYNIAHVNKLVERVKLQRDNNSYGGVKVQSNKVKLTDKGKEYCAQFDRYDFLFLED